MAHAASQRVGGRRVAQKVRRRHDQHAQDVEEHRGGDADRQRLQRSPSRQLTEEETDQLRKNFEARFPQFTAEQREEFIQGIVRRAAGGPTRRIVLPGPPPASPSRATRKERSINDVSTGKICKLFCTVMLIVACLIAFLVWCFWHSKLLHISLVKDDVNYFEILGLDASASAREIRQHYRKLARQYHPDRCQEKDCTEKFRRLTEAFERIVGVGQEGPGLGPGRWEDWSRESDDSSD